MAVMGPSGSGKTTLLHSLCGVESIDSGEILVNEQDLNSMTETEIAMFRKKNFGMIFQDFQLIESLSVKENILLPLIMNKVDSVEQFKAYEEVITPLDICELEERRITDISGGQKQRVAIARAFIHRPSLIFADEPTGNLDFHTTTEVIKCIVKMNKEYGTSLLIVTHDAYVASFCDRVLLLNEGVIETEIEKKQGDFKENIVEMLYRMGGAENDIL